MSKIRLSVLILASLLATDFLASKETSLQDAFKKYYAEYKKQSVVKLRTYGAPRKGPRGAAIKILEYSDFQCPYCQKMAYVLKQSYARCPNLISVEFKHYPLDKSCNTSMKRELHKSACKLAYSAYCAGKQRKFWPMHDEIFSNQKNLHGSVLDAQVEQLASRAKLNIGRFKACMRGRGVKHAISRDLKSGNDLNISGTPTTYVNGRKLGVAPILIEMLAEKIASEKAGRKVSCKVK